MHKPTEINTRRITDILQVSLQPERVIELFSQEVNRLIEHQAISYHNDEVNLDIKLGKQARHSCTYNLNIGDEPFGKLTLHRDRKFNATEVEELKQLLCSLAYPLRNALLYQDALEYGSKDPLTGISTRGIMDMMLQRDLKNAQVQKSSYSLLIIDIDHFKLVNDKYGHVVGDCVLKAASSMMDSQKRSGDILCRYGGEEFVVLMRDADIDEAQLLAESMRGYIEAHPCICSDEEINITVSIGLSTLQDGDYPKTLLERADQALYFAKGKGRNQVCFTN